VLLKTRHFQRTEAPWKLCTYLVFKDHALRQSQNSDTNKLLLLCQGFFSIVCFFFVALNRLTHLALFFSPGLVSLSEGRNVTQTIFSVKSFFTLFAVSD
jgi:hypothetical protein